MMPKLTDLPLEERREFAIDHLDEMYEGEERFGYLGYSYYGWRGNGLEMHFDIWCHIAGKQEVVTFLTPLLCYMDYLRDKAEAHVEALCEAENLRLGRVFKEIKLMPDEDDSLTNEPSSYIFSGDPRWYDFTYSCLGGKKPFEAMFQYENTLLDTPDDFVVCPGVEQRHRLYVIVPQMFLRKSVITDFLRELIRTDGQTYLIGKPVESKHLKKYLKKGRTGVYPHMKNLRRDGLMPGGRTPRTSARHALRRNQPRYFDLVK